MLLFWNESSLSRDVLREQVVHCACRTALRRRTPAFRRGNNRADLIAPAIVSVPASCRQHQQYANHPSADVDGTRARPMNVGPEDAQKRAGMSDISLAAKPAALPFVPVATTPAVRPRDVFLPGDCRR